MARACRVCGTVHEDGDCPLGGGSRKKAPKAPKVPRHTHVWKFKRRAYPIDGSRPYDIYACTFSGCPAIDERKV